MKPEELQAIAISSAKNYYNFLEQRGRGNVRNAVRSISISQNRCILTVTGKLSDLDRISFHVNQTVLVSDAIKIESYDEKASILILALTKEQVSLFRSCSPQDLFIVCDLKFLISRYCRWLESAQEQSIFPELPSVYPTIPFSYPFFDSFSPSQEQHDALDAIFSYPLTYVWGAPGTGKTQFVLAYSLLNYLQHCSGSSNKIFVLAPTNNALEQTLRGVLSLLQQTDFPPELLLRMGTPSSRFASDYPQCCEVAGITKRIASLRTQKNIYDKYLALISFSQRVHELECLLQSLSDFIPLASEFLDLTAKLASCKQQIASGRSTFDSLQVYCTSLTQQYSAAESEMQRLHHFIGRLFMGRKIKKLDADITYLRACREESQQRLSNQISLQNHLQIQADKLDARHSLMQHDVTAQIATMKEQSRFSSEISTIVAHLSPQNCLSVHGRLTDLLSQGQISLSNDAAFLESHSNLNLNLAHAERERLQLEMDTLLQKSTSGRLTSVSIIACTLDTYLARFSPSDFMESIEYQDSSGNASIVPIHFFLDEAGYCCLAKLLPIMHQRCPITLLGDHMQLPPVCEADVTDFTKKEYNSIVFWAQSALYLEDAFFLSLKDVFTRYYNSAPATFSVVKQIALTETYRFSQALAQVLDHAVYQIGFHGNAKATPVLIQFLNVLCRPGTKKRTNVLEAVAIAKLISMKPETFSNCAIITPYRNQRIEIEHSLHSFHLSSNDYPVLTVHASQGQEWDTVFLSVCDTENKWFTDSNHPNSKGKQLINTAVSRTKHRLILVCDSNYWSTQTNQLIQQLLSIASPL